MGKLGLQLYTLRTETPKDFLGTLAKVATECIGECVVMAS